MTHSDDQFLLASHKEYSGSYTDRILFNKPVVKINNLNPMANPTMYGPLEDGSSLGFWTFDNTIADSTSHGYDLQVLTGNLEYVPGPIPGTQALFFSGSNWLYVPSGSGDGLNLLAFSGSEKNMTIEFMFRPYLAPSNSYTEDDGFQAHLANTVVALMAQDLSPPEEVRNHETYPAYYFGFDELQHGATNNFVAEVYASAWPDYQNNYTYSPQERPVHQWSGISPPAKKFGLNQTITSSNYENLPSLWSHIVATVTQSKIIDFNNNSAITASFDWNIYINGRRTANHLYSFTFSFDTNGGFFFENVVSGAIREDEFRGDEDNRKEWGALRSQFFVGAMNNTRNGAAPEAYEYIPETTLSGVLSHLHIANRVLTPDEVKSRYESVFKPQTLFNPRLLLGSKAAVTGKRRKKLINFIQYVTNDADWENKSFKMTPETTGLDLSRFSSERNYYDFFYSDIITYVSGNATGKNNQFVSLYDSKEIFLDSLVPSPVDYHIFHGAEPILFENGTNTFGDRGLLKNRSFFLSVVGKGYDKSFIDRPPTINSQSNSVISGSTTLKYGDTDWGCIFPFEQKYSNFKRLKRPSKFLDKAYTVKVSDSGSYLPLGWIYGTRDSFGGANYGPMAKSINDGVLNTPVDTNIFSGIIVKCSKNLRTKVTEFETRKTGSVGSNYRSSISDFSILSDALRSDIDFSLGTPHGAAEGTFLHNRNLLFEPNLQDTYKYYFGTGRKYGQWGWVPGGHAEEEAPVIETDGTPGTHSRDGLNTGWAPVIWPFFVIGVKVAGWRYGLLSALPTKTSAVWRRDRYGQFRDMLEQRLYTRFNVDSNTAKGISTDKAGRTRSVIETRFVPNTDAWVTASNPELNTRDSGIYREFYTSGKPFSDSQD